MTTPQPLVRGELVEKGIIRLTLNSPRNFNALSMAMIEALNAALEEAYADPRVRVIILAAEGRGFCAGHDLKELRHHQENDADGGRAFFTELFDRCTAMTEAMTTAPRIIIAQVHGIATAAGTQLVASCDMVVASAQARFGVNGISAGLFCSTPMVPLSRAIGQKKCIELLTTGRLMDAEEARMSGLVNHIAAAGELSGKTLEMARAAAAKSGAVLAIGKQAFYRQAEMSLSDAYAYTRGVITENLLHADAREGICAFTEKRPPKWKDD